VTCRRFGDAVPESGATGVQAALRREWLARVKEGLDRAEVPNPTQRIRLLSGELRRG
jgi:hypothetical protein